MLTRIPFLDLKRPYIELKAEVEEAVTRVLGGGNYVLGTEVEAFEAEWASFCGVSGAAAVNSGTDALTLALKASGAVRFSGDEVITSTLAPGYTALAILNAGGVPVFADIDPDSYTISPESIEQSITARTRAVIPVHLYGRMAAMQAITDLARRHQLIVVEDAAQAHGAAIGGRAAGAWGHAAAFSFYPTKNLGACGDGGAITSNDAEIIRRVKVLRQGGHYAGLQTNVAGFNSRLDEIQAGVLRVKLTHLQTWNRLRAGLARIYLDALDKSQATIPSECAQESHVFHLFVVQHGERERLRVHLSERGIETMIHYPFLLHQQPLFRDRTQPTLPAAEDVVKRIISLPLYAQLSSEEVGEVARAIRAFNA